MKFVNPVSVHHRFKRGERDPIGNGSYRRVSHNNIILAPNSVVSNLNRILAPLKSVFFSVPIG